MTRLVTEWIRELEETAAVRDKELRRLTGAGYVKLAALTAGVPEKQIHLPNLCTCCNPDFLYSHRASKGKRGNLAAFLSLV